MNWYLEPWKKYADFSGRACRAEYWIFTLINFVIALVITFSENIVGSPGILSILFSLAVLLPSLAVGVRRLHDTGRSGWWILIALVPMIGTIIVLILFALPGKPEGDKYGPDPLAGAAPSL